MDITDILIKKGITKSELAERLGIHNQNVNKMLKNPTESSIAKIADALGVPMWQLFTTKEEILEDESGTSTGACPHCGKPITIKTTIE